MIFGNLPLMYFSIFFLNLALINFLCQLLYANARFSSFKAYMIIWIFQLRAVHGNWHVWKKSTWQMKLTWSAASAFSWEHKNENNNVVKHHIDNSKIRRLKKRSRYGKSTLKDNKQKKQPLVIWNRLSKSTGCTLSHVEFWLSPSQNKHWSPTSMRKAKANILTSLKGSVLEGFRKDEVQMKRSYLLL